MEATKPQRVQSLAESDLSRLPHQYVQPPELRPVRASVDVGGSGVPVVNLSASRDHLLPELRRVCREWGAFQIVNHGVPLPLLEEMRAVGLAFFRSPMEAKLRFACDPHSPASEGYGSRMLAKDDSVLDWRDYFDHHSLPESRRDPSRWPDFPSNYRNLVVEYSNSMKLLAQKLLCLISESLELPPSYIEEAIGEVYQNITVSYYPPCPQPDLVLGLQSHSDMGAITLLIQDDVGGLEVFKDDEWVAVQPLTNAIIVILADQTEIISNGEYRSAVHRAIVSSMNLGHYFADIFYHPKIKTRVSNSSTIGNDVFLH